MTKIQELEGSPFTTYFSSEKFILQQQEMDSAIYATIYYSIESGVSIIVQSTRKPMFNELNEAVYSYTLNPDSFEEFNDQIEKLEREYDTQAPQNIHNMSYKFFNLMPDSFFVDVSDETGAVCQKCSCQHYQRFIGTFFPAFRNYPASVELYNYYGCGIRESKEAYADNPYSMHRVIEIINNAFDSFSDEDSKAEVRNFRKELADALERSKS